MDDTKGSLFSRLTKLFRSGPIVRRKVRDFKQAGAASALEVFRKAHSDVYNSTLSAYGSFDRMCVDLDTLIPTPDKRGFISLREAIEKYPDEEKFLVYSYDHEKKCVVSAWASHPRSSGIRETVKVTFDDGSVLVCTPDHPCMTRDGNFKNAGELIQGESMMPFYRKKFATKKNSKRVVSVEKWKTIETGDLTVEGFENFATDTIFVHNSRYGDFCQMESTPEISSALDIYAEETCSSDDKGKVLHIYSENKRINELLEELFYDILNVDFNLAMWIRNLVKYGDMFLFNDISPEFGVINAYPIAISEIEREEGFDANDPMAVRFRWITQGNTVLENWQVSHFRLLGNDAFLPYGSSVLESARRIWRQLILMEDAMLVYRVIRAPERRVFYIDVGNIPPAEIENYMEQAVTSLKRQPAIDKTTGKMDYRYNPYAVDEDYYLAVRGGEGGTKIETLPGGVNATAIEDVEYIQKKLFAALKIPRAYLGYDEDVGCLTGDTIVNLLDGRNLTMKELVEEYNLGNKNWTYSFDRLGNPRPGLISKAWMTKLTNEIYHVLLDNGVTIKCTGNHPFMLRSGIYVRADQLVGNESLMALYRDVSSRDTGDFANGYEKVYNHEKKSWEYTHRLVVQSVTVSSHPSSLSESHTVIHHLSFDKRNNNPNKLSIIGKREHTKLHAAVAKISKIQESRDSLRHVMKTEKYKKMHHDTIECYQDHAGIKNHRVMSVRKENLTEPVEVFDIQVDGYHNFAVENSIVVHNSKATLAQEDIRFSRCISRIQRTVIAELNKLAMIHLYCHGFDEEDLSDFDLKLTNPSSIAQQQKLELIRTKFEIASASPEGVVDRYWIRKNVIGLTNDEISNIKDGRKADKEEDANIESSGSDGEAGGGETEDMSGADDLFSGDKPTGSLLTASPGSGQHNEEKEEEEDDSLDFSMDDEGAPDKADRQMKNAFGGPIKAGRKIRHGAAGTQMPDLAKMVMVGKNSRGQDSMNKPFDDDFLFNTFSESPDVRGTIQRPRLTNDLEKMFSAMSNKIGSNRKSLLSESLLDEDLLEEDNQNGET